jgi:hypothetical protein
VIQQTVTTMKFAKWIFFLAGIYGIAILFLYSQQRVAALILGSALIDLTLGVLFVLAFLRTPKA